MFNLKSSLSEYIALCRLLGEAGDSLELFASRREDEARLIAFLNEMDQDELKQMDEYVADICKHKRNKRKKPSPPEPYGSGGVFLREGYGSSAHCRGRCRAQLFATKGRYRCGLPLAGTHRPIPPHGSLLEDPRDCHGSRARKERAPGIP